MTRNGIELRVLGPLEMWCDGEPVAIGGAKQRAVLAVLLLREGEVVPVERLVDEVWGAEPPPSAARTIESYVSRLRQLFNGHGPTLSRRGSGYVIDLFDAALDARVFLAEHESAALAAAVDDHKSVLERTEAALALWRGPALADVALASAGRAEADRLEELRLHTYELRFDSELPLGRHEEAIGELQRLVAQNPYRERFVAQLMLALYRSGRHAEALDVYEQTRRRLDEDLGLQPSADLQQLSGQIVRQDPALRRTSPPSTGHTRPSPVNERRRRATVLVAAGVAVISALALTASGGAAVPDRVTPSAEKLALVLPGSADRLSVAASGLSTAVATSKFDYTLETQTAFIDLGAPGPDVDAVVARIRKGGVGVVVTLGDGPASRALAGVVRSLPETRFVFMDASVRDLALDGVSNAAAIRFADEDVFYLAGYASGLVPTMDGSRQHVDTVSVVAGEPNSHTTRRIAELRDGLRATRPGVKVRVDYSRELEDVTACESLANRQIDDGSDVVVAIAGRCSLGALAVARIRGVWGVGAEEDGIKLTDHILWASFKEWTPATRYAIEKLRKGTLAMGQDTVLGLGEDYSVHFWGSNRIPERVFSALIEECSDLRVKRHTDA